MERKDECVLAAASVGVGLRNSIHARPNIKLSTQGLELFRRTFVRGMQSLVTTRTHDVVNIRQTESSVDEIIARLRPE